MAAAPGPTLTITGPDGQPQPVSLIPLPLTEAELALLLHFLPPADGIPPVPTISPLGPPEVPAADAKRLTMKEMMAKMRQKVEADIERNKERRLELFLDKKKRRIPTDELVARGLVKTMN